MSNLKLCGLYMHRRVSMVPSSSGVIDMVLFRLAPVDEASRDFETHQQIVVSKLKRTAAGV